MNYQSFDQLTEISKIIKIELGDKGAPHQQVDATSLFMQ